MASRTKKPANKIAGREYSRPNDSIDSPRSARGSTTRLTHSRSINLRQSLNSERFKKLEELMSSYLSEKPDDIARSIADHVEYTLARQSQDLDSFGAYQATAYSVRDRLIEFWNDTEKHFVKSKTKMVYYFSIEYLIGRSLQNAIMNLELEGNYACALKDIGIILEEIYGEESDAALGNGGLGRLAACFLDSMATMDIPAWGYGLRYRYGMFKQLISGGDQVEHPDYWLMKGNPWEICRNDIAYPIRFGGFVTSYIDASGSVRWTWDGGMIVTAVAHDNPIPGYGTLNTISLRLWSSRPTTEIDYVHMDKTSYYEALKVRQHSEMITSVLYPNDSTQEGRDLRLKQQYFFSSASLQDIFVRFKKTHGEKALHKLGSLIAIQLNDTHPTISVVELMRILLDVEYMGWDDAWEITNAVFAYTNHTVLPEALEEWPVDYFESLLPRHMQLIYEINYRFLNGPVEKKWPGNNDIKTRLSIINENNGHVKRIRMSHLAIVGSHRVNGVAEIHTEILKNGIFRQFFDLWPEKFLNVTNGVTPRRWINTINHPLSSLLTKTLGNDLWVTDLDKLTQIKNYVNDPEFQRELMNAKLNAKVRLSALIHRETSGRVIPNPNMLFDIHVKRIHEYKRQLLNVLAIIHRYLHIKKHPKEKHVPRLYLFAGKAAPAYVTAKNIIKLIYCVGEVVNNDPDVNDLLKIVFLPDYNVSLAEVIVPANDISQHISTVGTEASGTSNMKFAMNGGLILGTYDGANIEIAKEVGEENMFLFGLKSNEVDEARKHHQPIDGRLKEVFDAIYMNRFADSKTTQDHFVDMIDKLAYGNDRFLLTNDFASYLNAIKRVDDTWWDKAKWASMAVATISGMGKFSSDRTISDYANNIWGVGPSRVPEDEQTHE